MYSFLLKSIFNFLRLCSFNPKVKQWAIGQEELFGRLKNKKLGNNKLVLFHCASLGEYEQGRPVIDLFKQQNADYQIVVSFFSPSGFDTVAAKLSDAEDFITYLPLDTKQNVKQFLDLLRPKIVFLVKYEFWPNLIQELSARKIPIVCFSANFRANQVYFKLKFFKEILRKVDLFFVQNEISKNLLQSIGKEEVIVQSDTRLERILSRKTSANFNSKIKQFVGAEKCFLLGSVYAQDYALIAFDELQKQGLKILIFPHEVNEKSIGFWLKKFPSAVRFSDESQGFLKPSIMVVDEVGLLADAYQFASGAFVGGAFNKGVHNVLEPAVFGIPIFVGASNNQKFLEVTELKNLKVLFEISESLSMAKKLQFFKNNPADVQKISEICVSFLESKTHAASQILMQVNQKIKF